MRPQKPKVELTGVGRPYIYVGLGTKKVSAELPPLRFDAKTAAAASPTPRQASSVVDLSMVDDGVAVKGGGDPNSGCGAMSAAAIAVGGRCLRGGWVPKKIDAPL